MTIPDDQLAPLLAIYPGAKLFQEGAKAFVFIPNLPVVVQEATRYLDALLCPTEHTGYTTRLFLSKPIVERPTIGANAANWTVHNILGREWHSWSWQGVSPDLSLPQMLLAHVSALR